MEIEKNSQTSIKILILNVPRETRQRIETDHRIEPPIYLRDFEITLDFLTLFEKNLKKPSCRAQKVRK